MPTRHGRADPFITWEEAQKLPRTYRRKRRKCKHDWRTIVDPLKWGWQRICPLCGMRARY